ncbi:MAG: serine/threonine-protein kinase [Candidatus Brocadiia bacterium]
MKPRQFGPYTLLEHMGKGGMGSVYRASEGEGGRIVAVKVFESGEDREPETSRKLRDREVRMLVSVQHPNIVKFFESGQVDDDYYYTMEFVARSLPDLMRSDRELSIVSVVHVLRQTASALGAIHHQAVVHRDIKPANVLLDEDPGGALHVKLTDLGIAKNVSEPDIVREQTRRAIPGTPRFLSPEQIKQEPLDGRSDVFSLGIVAYELLSGSRPFTAEDSTGYLRANLRQQQRPVSELNPKVPPFLNRMVQKMLAKKREERYDSETLARDLELVHQHLISQAPLVERANPASIFYQAPPKAARPLYEQISCL